MDKLKEEKESKFAIRTIMPRVLKAVFKMALAYALWFVFSVFIAPFEGLYSYQSLFTPLIALFLFFVFVIELSHGTVFQHVFSIANSLMIVVYFACTMNSGVINFTVEQINFIVDIRFFFALLVIGGLLGFAKSMLRLLNWMNEKEEQWLQYQIKSL